MNCKEVGFRAFYKHFSVFKITEKDKKILEGFPGAEQADYFLTAPIGNHHIILPGHHKEVLEAIAQSIK